MVVQFAEGFLRWIGRLRRILHVVWVPVLPQQIIRWTVRREKIKRGILRQWRVDKKREKREEREKTEKTDKGEEREKSEVKRTCFNR